MQIMDKILICDDNKVNLLLLSTLLKQPGREIIQVESGQEALNKISSIADISLIIMDIQMPGIDGYETVKRIKENKEHEDVPVIFVTGFNKSESNVNFGYEIGAYDYLFKPIEPHEIKNKVNIFLSLFKQKKQLQQETTEATLLSLCSQAIIMATAENELLNYISDNIVKVTGYSLSWVGRCVYDSTSNLIDIDPIVLSVNSAEKFELNPAKINENFKPDILNSISINSDPTKFTMKVLNTSDIGLKCCISVPLIINHNIWGYLNLYKTQSDNFKDWEQALISNVTNIIVLGLISIRSQKDKLKAEEALVIEKEELSIALKNIADGVISISKEGRIIYANKAAEEIFELTIGQMTGKYIFDTLKILEHDNNITLFNPIDWLEYSAIATSNKRQLTVITLNDIKKIITADATMVLDSTGTFKGSIITLNDVSEKIRTENQKALSQKMESVGQLAAGIAHEINTPMQFLGDNTYFIQDSFKSFIEYIDLVSQTLNISNVNDIGFDNIRKRIKSKEDEIDISYLRDEIPIAIDRIQIGIARVSKIVLAMKNFSHSSQKQKSQSNINQGVDVTTTISKNEWKYVAELETILDPNLPLVECCIDEINQVLLNMVVNAAHAIADNIPKGSSDLGKITIETKQNGNFVEIKISDTGCGIPTDKIPRIWEPFYTTKEVGKGTGQGLAIAHDIVVNKHNGEILVDSELGKGTSFTIRLPIR